MSRGVIQPDMWGVDLAGSRHDWPGLRSRIAQHGVRRPPSCLPCHSCMPPLLLDIPLTTTPTSSPASAMGLDGRVCRAQVRNSLLVAPMPTASTSQILGNNECFEPYTSNIYVRRVLSGEFTVVNQHLLHDLTSLGLWCPEIKNQLVAANGSVQARLSPCRVQTRVA